MGWSHDGRIWNMWLVRHSGLAGAWTLAVIVVRALTRGLAGVPDAQDPLNKPDRRLAAGKVSIRECYQRRRTSVGGHWT